MARVARSEMITHTRVTGAAATDSLSLCGLLRKELAMDKAGHDPDVMIS